MYNADHALLRTAAVAVVNHGTFSTTGLQHMTAMLQCECAANDLAACCCSLTARIKAMVFVVTTAA
jgi:hypothetical protein